MEIAEDWQAEALLGALWDGGIHIAEIVLRTPIALRAISLASKAFPDFVIGAGTVMTETEAATAIDAGARFVASPVTDIGIITRCRSEGVEAFPGVFTPTEIYAARSLGVPVVKYFPAEAGGGPQFLHSVAAAMPDVRFLPTGGVTLEKIETYMGLPEVIACGSSAICARALVGSGEFTEVTRRAREARAAVRRARPELEK